MSEITVLFTIKEVLQQLELELNRLTVDTTNISLEEWKAYIIARTLEDLFLVDISPKYCRQMESVASLVRSNYRRVVDEETLTIHKDVGTNNLYQYVGSSDLPFESDLELHRHCVVIRPRKSPLTL